ncbi:unnamed protein product [Phytophthora fragariaefolia]|uniref:glucan endo-1,3-beta-D-glucosidase n=1 Tax=Phytophthora fragariaefolia TaxID=1490495 RepID=A0A9W6XYX5_9STRA|nr:unnamed protein product [Phytophthora fragariaefolia]
MTSDSTIHPPQFVPNHVTGIFFDNKADYATWFSAEKYCIHGIQMIPVSPINGLVRTTTFIQEEWDDILSKEAIVTGADTTNAWLSLLLVNQAAINQADALPKLLRATMDDGLTRSWALYNAVSRGVSQPSSNSKEVATLAPSSPTTMPMTFPVGTRVPSVYTAAPTGTKVPTPVATTATPTTTSVPSSMTLAPEVPITPPISQKENYTEEPATTPASATAPPSPSTVSPTATIQPSAATSAPATTTGSHYPGWTSIPPGWTSTPPGWTSIPPGMTSIPPGWTSHTPGVVVPADMNRSL